jgi:cold shock CspA family protein
MHRGTVEFYNKTRKFGFIINEDESLQESYLFHSDTELNSGDIVEFELSTAGEKGPKVKNLVKVEQ